MLVVRLSKRLVLDGRLKPMKIALNIVSVVLVVIGAIWLLQGMNVLPDGS
jgi:heme/copper-type cytochrome/quinol oxidase subunit 4